jgi:hypothetical protein
VRELDGTRLIDAASGWHDHGAGDFSSIHHYPAPMCGISGLNDSHLSYDNRRIAFQSEFGGLGLLPAQEKFEALILILPAEAY